MEKSPQKTIWEDADLKKNPIIIIGRLQILSKSISSLPADQVGNDKRLLLAQGLTDICYYTDSSVQTGGLQDGSARLYT